MGEGIGNPSPTRGGKPRSIRSWRAGSETTPRQAIPRRRAARSFIEELIRGGLDAARTVAADALIASTYLTGTDTRRARRALLALFGGAVGKDVVSRIVHSTMLGTLKVLSGLLANFALILPKSFPLPSAATLGKRVALGQISASRGP